MELNTPQGILFGYAGARVHQPGQKAVVFIHGTGMDHTVWVLPSRYFARHGYNVLAPDLPGHGRSGGAPAATIDAMADAVVAGMSAAGIEQAALVGHSMGSLVALSAAGRYPDRTRVLALIGSTAPMAVHPKLLEHAEKNDHAAIDMLTYWSYSKDAQLGGSETPGLWMAGNTLRLLERAADNVIHIDLAACQAYDAGLAHAQAVQCPTLFVLGERDIMTPVRSAQGVIDAVTNARVSVLEGCGHSIMLERPEALLDALITIV